MKAVLISIKPKWCMKIANGEKTIEVRKTKPNLKTPFKCYIYMTMNGVPKFVYNKNLEKESIYDRDPNTANGRVIGEFVCKGIMQPFDSLRLMAKESCLTENELLNYSKGKTLYGWRIADLKIYDKPKELSELKTPEWFRDCEKTCPDIERMRCPSNDSRKVSKMCGWCRGGGNSVERPPQSWCYVEEME